MGLPRFARRNGSRQESSLFPDWGSGFETSPFSERSEAFSETLTSCSNRDQSQAERSGGERERTDDNFEDERGASSKDNRRNHHKTRGDGSSQEP